MKKEKSKKEAIMDCALELFTEKGFDGTSTTRITKNAGVGTGTLFVHFENKADLINALFRNIKKEMIEVLRPFADSESTNEKVIRDIWMAMIKWGVKNPQKIMYIQQSITSPYITEATREEVNQDTEILTSLIQKGIDHGILKKQPVDLLLRAIWSVLYTTIFYMIESGKYRRKVADDTFTMIWDMIRSS
jgi:AcrR family transcriptional regulator